MPSRARYAADAMLARGLDDLLGMDDWNPVVAGLLQSHWVDGPPTGARTLADGSSIDLSQVVNMANCQKAFGMLAGGYRRGNVRPALGRE